MKKRLGRVNSYFGFALSFGITLAISIYVLFMGGQWLDNRLSTAPLFMLLGVLLAIATVFKGLIADIQVLDRKHREDKEDKEDKEE